eukprot:5277405-Pleurochrysis_carterae.AAC.1
MALPAGAGAPPAPALTASPSGRERGTVAAARAGGEGGVTGGLGDAGRGGTLPQAGDTHTPPGEDPRATHAAEAPPPWAGAPP